MRDLHHTLLLGGAKGGGECSVAYTDGQINLKEIGYEGTEWVELT